MKKILTILCIAAAALFAFAPQASADSQTLRELAENMNKDTSSGIYCEYNGKFFKITMIESNSELQDVWIDSGEEELRNSVVQDPTFRGIMKMLYDNGSAFMLVIDCGERGERSFYFTMPEEKAILGL